MRQWWQIHIHRGCEHLRRHFFVQKICTTKGGLQGLCNCQSFLTRARAMRPGPWGQGHEGFVGRGTLRVAWVHRDQQWRSISQASSQAILLPGSIKEQWIRSHGWSLGRTHFRERGLHSWHRKIRRCLCRSESFWQMIVAFLKVIWLSSQFKCLSLRGLSLLPILNGLL